MAHNFLPTHRIFSPRRRRGGAISYEYVYIRDMTIYICEIFGFLKKWENENKILTLLLFTTINNLAYKWYLNLLISFTTINNTLIFLSYPINTVMTHTIHADPRKCTITPDAWKPPKDCHPLIVSRSWPDIERDEPLDVTVSILIM